jgi:hypothetical protein
MKALRVGGSAHDRCDDFDLPVENDGLARIAETP